jgi:hypothetical protein
LGAGIGPIVYLILWVVLPVQYGTPASNTAYTPPASDSAEQATTNDSFETAPKKVRTNLIMGLILIGMGVLFLIDNLVSFEFFSTYWPVLLIIAGLSILFANFNKNNEQK